MTKYVPTCSGNMVKVDAKGRIVLPQELREDLGITPGTEVAIRAEGGRAIVEPEDDPEKIIQRMEELIEETAAVSEPSAFGDDRDAIVTKHAAAIRRGAETSRDE